MYEDLRYRVRVDAESHYISEQSDPEQGRFVFTYTVSIHNDGSLPAQLMHRYWKITDGDGVIREDRLGFSTIYVQAKRRAPDHAVSRPEVQAFVLVQDFWDTWGSVG